MDPLVQWAPNYAGVAQLYAAILQELVSRVPRNSVRDMLQRVALVTPTAQRYFLADDTIFSGYPYASSTAPCNMVVSQSADYVMIGLSGTQTTAAVADTVNEYLEGVGGGEPASLGGTSTRRPSFVSWAANFWNLALTVATVNNKHIRIFGHSLGGAIALYMAETASYVTGVRSIHLCTFGAPKAWDSNLRYRTSVQYARWVNPTDNVPRLPPDPAQAPELWALLSRAQQQRVLSWRHPNSGLNVDSSGIITSVGDQPSSPITLDTVQAALTSPQGITGAGHGIDTYKAYLIGAYSGSVSISTRETIAPQTAGPAPVAMPPNANVPAARPALPIPADTTARRVAYSAAAAAREPSSPQVPQPAKVHAVKLDGYWAIEWMGFIIAYAPTKKKARACARHINTFLTLFIGVASCDSQAFVYALATWLTSAADPASGFIPRLNDNGSGASIAIE